MDTVIDQLQPHDFDQLIDHLDEAYQRGSDQSFRESLCPISTDHADLSTHRRYVIRREGRIAASVGVFSYHLHLDGHTLSMAGIGSVSTSPEHRRQGLMTHLMSHVARMLPEQGYHLAWLAGQRQRYRHFGWEIAGSEFQYEVTRINIAHTWPDRPSTALELHPLDHRRDLLPQLICLRRGRPFRIARFPFPLSRRQHAYIAIDCASQPIGYLVFDSDHQTIVELLGRDHHVEFDMIRVALEASGRDRISVCLPPFAFPLHRALAQNVSYPTLRHSGNWQIFDWRATVHALLHARHRIQPLLPGQLVIEVPRHTRLRLTVDDAGPRVEPTSAPADLVADGMRMTQLLIGHLSPVFLTDLPPAARILNAWCPLPIHMPFCDRC